jgi:exosortase/archaeosortase family protein
MIALFVGEAFRCTALKRVLLLVIGLAFAFLLNLGRTTFLVWSAAHDGITKIESRHDAAGLVASVVLFALLWFLSRRWASPPEKPAEPARFGLSSLAARAVGYPAGFGRRRRSAHRVMVSLSRGRLRGHPALERGLADQPNRLPSGQGFRDRAEYVALRCQSRRGVTRTIISGCFSFCDGGPEKIQRNSLKATLPMFAFRRQAAN